MFDKWFEMFSNRLYKSNDRLVSSKELWLDTHINKTKQYNNILHIQDQVMKKDINKLYSLWEELNHYNGDKE